MKQVTRCYGCNKIIRIAGSFKAEIGETIVLTDEFGIKESRHIKKKITLCRMCTETAGYKVKTGWVGRYKYPDIESKIDKISQ